MPVTIRSGEIVAFEASGLGIVDQRNFGNPQLGQTEKVENVQFIRGGGRASTDLVAIVTSLSEANRIDAIEASAFENGTVDRKTCGTELD